MIDWLTKLSERERLLYRIAMKNAKDPDLVDEIIFNSLIIDPERSKREDSQNIDEWLNSPDSKQGTVELGTCNGIRFLTSEGIKEMKPGKIYDQRLNEL